MNKHTKLIVLIFYIVLMVSFYVSGRSERVLLLDGIIAILSYMFILDMKVKEETK